MKIFIYLTFTLLLRVTNCGIIKLISAPKSSDIGPEPCITQCFGSTGENTSWIKSEEKYAETNIDISSCGFNPGTSPMLVASLVGDYNYIAGPPNLNPLNDGSYQIDVVRIYGTLHIGETAIENQWRVDWVATGYTC